MAAKLKTMMTIAGTDPTGGAGIASDIRVASSLGLHTLPVVTCVTSQNSKGLKSYGILSPETLKLQLRSVVEDVIPDAVKIGLVANPENLKIISDFLEELPGSVPVVVDPLLGISADKRADRNENLLKEIVEVYSFYIFPKATVVTPNLEELKTFKQIIGEKQMETLMGSTPFIIKGGHSDGDSIDDKLISNGETITTTHPRVECSNLHGTGCVFSSFITSFLALGFSLEEAFMKTSQRLYEIILGSRGYQLGSSTYGPLNITLDYLLG